MTNFSNGLTDAEEERLTLLMEECAEVIQAAAKIKRHGWFSYSPDDPKKVRNLDSLMKELRDVQIAVQFLRDAGDLPPNEYTREEYKNKLKYMHYQKELE